eukprot:1161066-Pelagomonas_calceolata.AAC.1
MKRFGGAREAVKRCRSRQAMFSCLKFFINSINAYIQTLEISGAVPQVASEAELKPAVRSWAAAAEADASPITQATGQQV